MSGLSPTSWAYAEEFIDDDEAIAAARREGQQRRLSPVGPGAGALLRTVVAATAAGSVVEIGTGTGTSGLYLLGGMTETGLLTTIDNDAQAQQVAKAAFQEAGYPAQRFRAIAGDALTVMPRLTDGAYDVVVIDADRSSYPEFIDHAGRLLRAGGTLLLLNMLGNDKVADPVARDDATAALRSSGKALRDHEDFTCALVPSSTGVLIAVKNAPDSSG